MSKYLVAYEEWLGGSLQAHRLKSNIIELETLPKDDTSLRRLEVKIGKKYLNEPDGSSVTVIGITPL